MDLDVPAAGDLAVSIYIPENVKADTMHSVGLHTAYVSKQGDATAQPAMADAITTQAYYWLANVDVTAPADAAAIVAFGDSITDSRASSLTPIGAGPVSWPGVWRPQAAEISRC